MKGILFSPEMARVAMSGAKTVTRRVMSPQPTWDGRFWNWRLDRFGDATNIEMSWGAYVPIEEQQPWDYCEYRVGERRCLLTTWAVHREFDSARPLQLHASYIEQHPLRGTREFWHAGQVRSLTGHEKPDWAGKSRPGRFLSNNLRHLMPQFEIVSVRAERVQDITAAEARNEGVTIPCVPVEGNPLQGRPLLRITGEYPPDQYSPKPTAEWTADDWWITHFASLWDSINAERGFGWDVNPWVWRVEFRKVEVAQS